MSDEGQTSPGEVAGPLGCCCGGAGRKRACSASPPGMGPSLEGPAWENFSPRLSQIFIYIRGLSWWLSWYRTHLQCRRPGLDPWVGKIPRRRDRLPIPVLLGFPGGSAGKESACNVGDLGSIPGVGRSPGEGNATHSSILAWGISWTIGFTGSQRVRHD